MSNKPRNLFDFADKPSSDAPYSQSQITRARKREVYKYGFGYRVKGDPKLSDYQPYYDVNVVRNSSPVRYTCSCWDNQYGDTRRRNLCSHVVAVILGVEEGRLPEPITESEPYENGAEDNTRGLGQVDNGRDNGRERKLRLATSEGEYVQLNSRSTNRFPQPNDTGAGDGGRADQGFGRADGNGIRTDIPAISTGGADEFRQEPLPDPALQLPPGFPIPWFTKFRPQQRRAIDGILEEFDKGAKVVWADAPTGSGKTLIAEVVRRELKARAIHITITKGLQEQILKDFSFAVDIRGRSNYATLDYPDLFDAPWPNNVTCDDCDKSATSFVDEEGREGNTWDCSYCSVVDDCPYSVQKNLALRADLVVTNAAYWLTEVNKGRGRFSQWPLVTIDEVDGLESILRGQIEVSISPRMQRTLGIQPPARKTIKETWPEWFDEEAIPAALKYARALPEPTTPREMKEAKNISNLIEKLLIARSNIDAMIYDYESGMDREESYITFKPVTVGQFGPGMLWRHAGRFLCLSATIISPDQLAENLGCNLPYGFVNVPSTFPVANRPIRLLPLASMTNKNKDVAWPKMVEGLRKVLAYHPNERTMIHSVSYALTRAIVDGLRSTGRPIFSYANASERSTVLEEYKQTEGAVLVAPSMDRGVDLPDDLARVVVVAKIPHLSLGDKQVSTRLYETTGGQSWYAIEALRSLVQMTGRGVRHEDDRCTSYICDEQIWSYLKGRWKKYLPKWWLDAIVVNGTYRKEIMAING